MKKLIMTAHSIFFHVSASVLVLVNTSSSSTCNLVLEVSVKSGVSAALLSRVE